MTTKEEIKATIEQFFKAMDTQDLPLMEQLIPEDISMIHIGTDEGEIWRGAEELQIATEKQFQSLQHYKATVRNLTINLSQNQKTAWYFHLLDAHIKSNGQETIWESARFTGVAEKRNGRWKLVQTHVSLPG